MNDRHVVIIGGGLSGLAAGCYALRSGFKVTIAEHNTALGGVCTSWQRGPYMVDGCIHWLTGGSFQRIYEELEIVPKVALRTLDSWATYRDARDGFELDFTRNLDVLFARLAEVSREDGPELERLRLGADAFASLKVPLDAPELSSPGDSLRSLWEMRGALASLAHFRQPIGAWARDHLESPRLRRLFTKMLPDTAPASFLLMLLGYLSRGYLSRPVGGTAAFRDALVDTYRRLGGETRLHATVDEILAQSGRACGVRLSDGSLLPADVVVSTSSTPETVLRLLGGQFDAEPTRERIRKWKMFEPIVVASYGVAEPYARTPSLLTIDGVSPVEVGGKSLETLILRVCNDDPTFAPHGHSVVQALLPTSYDWWATRGHGYEAAKDGLSETITAALEPHFPGLRAGIRMTDLVTPLTYWNKSRSWRGAHEGWMPNSESLFGHVKKKLHGLDGFYMAGQWVEPGGGVPTAVMSGRQAIQLVCDDEGRTFVPSA